MQPISELRLLDMQYIYAIENKNTGKFYIGRTNDPDARKRCHFSELRRNVHGNPRLQASFNKHGEDAFVFQVVDSAEDDQIESKEAEWFAYFDHDKSYLYNCHFETFGGPKIYGPMDEAIKTKIADAIKDGTRKYIFDILDEGYETKVGLNSLARKHGVGGTTLLAYKQEWEMLRGKEYGHPQADPAKEKVRKFAEAFKQFGNDALDLVSKLNLTQKTLRKYLPEFGLSIEQTYRNRDYRQAANDKALQAVKYRLETGCSASEAIKYAVATTTTFYKLWKQRDSLAIA